MALTISSTHGISSAGEISESAPQAPSYNGLTEGPLSPFKLISEDVLVKIFSRIEEDPRHLARLACICRRFARVVRNVCWKRQCTRIVPEIMPSPQTHLDQIPEPPGGWGALMKVLVCCPGLKHAGVGTTCWDFGLEREIGPMELYNIGPRYVPKRRIAADNAQRPVSGELTTAAAVDAVFSETGRREQLIAATENSPVQTYTLSVRDSSVQSYTTSRRDSSVGSNSTSVMRSGQVVERSAVTVENGNGQASEKDSSAMDAFVQGTVSGEQSASNGDPSVGPKCISEGGGHGNGQSSEKDSSATVDAFVQGTGSGEQSASNGVLSVGPKCFTEGGGQEQDKLDKSVALTEESSRSFLGKNPPFGMLNGESKAASASEAGIVQSNTQQLSNAPIAVNEISPTGYLHAGMSDKNGRSSSIDPSSTTVEVHYGSGRPPRGKPVKRVHWNEEELASKADKVGGSKFGGSGGEHFTERDRGRSRKRKERALRRILAKIPEDPKQRLHVVPAKWTLPREEGSRLLASRFRCDSLYICDWPGCVHPGEKRNYKLFRGFVKNFKTSLLCRNLKDMNARKIDSACAFCSATSTWDMMTAFCLRRSFEYHDDGEPVVHARVCENGHVSGAWTDRPGVFVAH